MVNMHDSKSCPARGESSSLSSGTASNFYQSMTENNTKPPQSQIIVVALVLGLILYFVFLKKPSTEQSPNLQEQPTKELSESISSHATIEPPKTLDILTSEDKLRAQIRKYFAVYTYREWNRPAHENEKDAFDALITEIKIEDGARGKTITVKYNNRGKGVVLRDFGGLFDADGIIYKAIFSYGENVQKAIVEYYFLNFQDKYGNECRILASASKIDNQSTIAKVNWENIPVEELVKYWREETYMADVDTINCK